MPKVRVRYIFISHSYRDADLYHKLIAELRKRPKFAFQDRSVPDTRLIEAKNVKAAIRRNINDSDVMLIFTRPITGRSPMIKFEIDSARKLGKPIIAIKPAERRNVSTAVRQAATVLIDWDIEEIVRQIRNPGSPPIKRVAPVFVVNDTANAPVEIISPPPMPIRTRESFKDVLKRTLGFRKRYSAVSPKPAVSGISEIERDIDQR